MRRSGFWAAGLFLVLAACTNAPSSGTARPPETQLVNVGDAKIAALNYKSSGQYDRDLATVGSDAQSWVAQRASAVTRPALVLDIDETSLSNWPVIQRNDFGRSLAGPCNPAADAPCGLAAWDQLGVDEAIAPTLALYKSAVAAKVAVFFITGRPESQRKATERNLARVGYVGYSKLYMTPDGSHFASAADFKAPVRAQIEQQGYTIIANMGDQPSDLAGGHAEKTFQLPNPFYRIP